MTVIDNRPNAEVWTPKPTVPMIETASLVRNEVTFPLDSPVEDFVKHYINLDRIRNHIAFVAEEKFGQAFWDGLDKVYDK